MLSFFYLLNRLRLRKAVIVEFLGAPAVGKSTTYDLVNKRLGGVLRASELRRLTIRNVGLEFYFFLISYLVNGGNRDCSLRFLKELMYFFRVVEIDLKAVGAGRPVILEEGVAHNFMPASLSGVSEGQFELFLRNRVFIYLRADSAELVLSRLRSREIGKGVFLAGHVGLCDVEIVSRVDLYQVQADALVEKIKAAGGRVLVLSASDSAKDNSHAVLSLLQELNCE